MTQFRPSLLLVAFTVALALSGIVLATNIPMSSDPAWGFLAVEAMHHGGAFNHIVSPDPGNIAIDKSVFLSAWSPGQYALPYFIERLGLSFGNSLVMVNVLAILLGLAGWFAFYRTVGFSRYVSSLACLFMVCSAWFGLGLSAYYGGDTLLFGIAPWAAGYIWRQGVLSHRTVLPIAGFLTVLAFVKLSGVIWGLALVAACVLTAHDRWTAKLRSGGFAALAAGLFAALFYVFWLSKGATAVTSVGTSQAGLSLISVSFPIVGPLSAVPNAGRVLEQVVSCPCRPGLPPPSFFFNLALPFAIAIYALVYRTLKKDKVLARYADFAGLALAAYCAVFTMLFLHGSNIFLEDRHFRIVGLLVLPALIQIIATDRSRLIRMLFWFIFAAELLYTVYSFYPRIRMNANYALSRLGFRDDRASAAVLREMQSRIARTPGAVLYLCSPSLALEFPEARRIIPFTGEDEPADILAARSYRGRVGTLYLLLPKAMEGNGKAMAIMQSFRDYSADEWRIADIGEYVLFSAISATTASHGNPSDQGPK